MRKGLKVWVLRCFLAFLIIFTLQTLFVHRDRVTPERVELSEILSQDSLSEGDYALILSQTGLGVPAVDKLFSAGETSKILEYQEAYLADYEIVCTEIGGIIIRGDELKNTTAPDFVDLQAGDILLTLSTHTFAWRHGHIAIVIDENCVLEGTALGQPSGLHTLDSWRKCSNYYVLRVADSDKKVRKQVADFAVSNLADVPYGMFSGIFSDKSYDDERFSAQCAYLIWYAWNEFGVDLDGNGGLVTMPADFLLSEKVEIVQMF